MLVDRLWTFMPNSIRELKGKTKQKQNKTKTKTILRLLNFDQMLTLNTKFQTAVIIFYFLSFFINNRGPTKQEHRCEIMGSLKWICPCTDPLEKKKKKKKKKVKALHDEVTQLVISWETSNSFGSGKNTHPRAQFVSLERKEKSTTWWEEHLIPHLTQTDPLFVFLIWEEGLTQFYYIFLCKGKK